jgi:DNA-binding SARP family transcriptional activator
MTALSLEIRLLGRLEVLAGGEPLTLGGARQRALLALLALRAGELVPRDRLIDDLWGGERSDNAPNALAALVARVRKALPAEALVTHEGGYELRIDAESTDLVQFERLFAEGAAAEPAIASKLLREALALWHGPALAEFAYEAWAQLVIGRLDELRLAALEARIDADLATGSAADLVGELEALVHEHPLRERLRGQLMLALYRAGRQADALEAYRQARRTLVDELGIEPNPELHELEQAILRQDSALAPGRPTAARRVVLACALDPARADSLLALAEPLAAKSDREVLLLVIAQQDGLSDATNLARDRAEAAAGRGIAMRAAAFTSPEPAEDVLKVVREHDVDLLLIDAPSGAFPGALAPVLDRAPCDVGVLFGHGTLADFPSGRPVLVPFGGAEHEWAAVEVGAWLARVAGVALRLAGTASGDGHRDASRLLATASLVVQNTAGVAAEPHLVEPGPDGIISASRDTCMVVIGLSDRWREDGLGETRQAVATGADTPVLVVRGGVRPSGLAPRESMTRYTWSLSAAD